MTTPGRPVSLASTETIGRPSHRQQPGATCWRVGSVTGRSRKRESVANHRRRGGGADHVRNREQCVRQSDVDLFRDLDCVIHLDASVDHVVDVAGPGTLEQSMAAVRVGGHILIGSKDKRAVNLPCKPIATCHARWRSACGDASRGAELLIPRYDIAGIVPGGRRGASPTSIMSRGAALPFCGGWATRYLGRWGPIRTALHRQRRGAKSLLRPHPMESSADRQKKTSVCYIKLGRFWVQPTNSHVTED